MTRLDGDGPHVGCIKAWIGAYSVLDAVCLVRDGEIPLDEFSNYDAKKFEEVAKMIREYNAANTKDEE